MKPELGGGWGILGHSESGVKSRKIATMALGSCRAVLFFLRCVFTGCVCGGCGVAECIGVGWGVPEDEGSGSLVVWFIEGSQ
jgi:hypothetical protein